MNEVWKELPGFDGFMASDLGRIKRVAAGQGRRPGKCLTPHSASNGYQQVRIRKDGKSHVVSLHRAICAAFYGRCPEGWHVRHLDGDKRNNRLENLRYGTPKENGEDNVRLGVMVRGSDHHAAIFSEDQAQQIVDLLAADESPTVIASNVGVPRNAVYKIKYGESWAWLRPSANNRAVDRATT